jgi:hypothetical protein
MQRPTFFLVKFDHFVDLFLGAWLENLRGLLARRPRASLPPPPDTPEAVSRRLWRKHAIGKLTGLAIVAVLAQLIAIGIWLFTVDAHLRGAVGWEMLRTVAKRFALHVGLAGGVIIVARMLRLILWKAGVRSFTRALIYRILILIAAGLFFEALGRIFWVALAAAAIFYLAWDAARTVASRPLTEKNPLEKQPLDPEIAAALALAQRPDVRTIVFGHTHAPADIEIAPGKRFINSGTWVKVVDVRNVRDEPTELNTYVLVDPNGEAHLMSWRGTHPARRYAERAA